MIKKKTILFVGAFGSASSEEGHTGGQLFACNSLLASEAAREFNWLLIDSMASTNRQRSLWERLSKAVIRFLAFVRLLPKADVVLLFSSAGFSFTEKGCMALLARRFGKKVVLAPRSGLLQDALEKKGWQRAFARRVIRRVDCLLCQSLFWKDFYYKLAGGPKEKYVHRPNWIDVRPYLELHAAGEREGQRPKVLFLGWITRNKGVFDLIAAARLLGEDCPEIMLAGDGDGMEEARRQVQAAGLEGCIQLKGWVGADEKMRLLAESEIFVLPSYRDGYPNALLEAMASGLACVASRAGSIPEIIVSGKHGLLVEAGEPEQIADALRLLIRDVPLRRQLADAARRRVLQNNSLEQATRDLADLLHQL